MKINWKIRLKNPIFWIGIIGTIMTAMGVHPEMLTDWSIVGDKLLELVKNPFMLISVIAAIHGVIVDPTTPGICDSVRALEYNELGGANNDKQ